MFTQIPQAVSKAFANNSFHMAIKVLGNGSHALDVYTNHFAEFNTHWYVNEVEEAFECDVTDCTENSNYSYMLIEFCDCNPTVNDMKKWAEAFSGKRGVKVYGAWLNGMF